MSEELNFKYGVINIKLQSSRVGIDKEEAYINLIKNLVERKIHNPVSQNKHVILYSCYRARTGTNINYLHGKIGKGIHFEKESGPAIDINSSTSETVHNDTSKIFDVTISDYIFIPSNHRFCIRLGEKISIKDVWKFLNDSIPIVKDQNDIARIEVETEPMIIEEILSAKKIHKVDYIITYTNDDILKETANLFDQRLKRSQIGKLEVKAESDHHDFMKIEGEELLEGGIQLARSNGIIRQATITTQQDEKKTIKSKESPLRLELKATIERVKIHLVNLILETFKPRIEDNE